MDLELYLMENLTKFKVHSSENLKAYIKYVIKYNGEGKISQTIYVPTEANVPILEAGKR